MASFKKRFGRATLTATAAVLVMTLACFTAKAAQPDGRISFSIAPQSLSSALLAFSELTDVQISTASADLAGVSSPGVVGEFTREQALEKILSSTGLTYRRLDEKTVAITVRDTATGAGSKSTQAESGTAVSSRLAQAVDSGPTAGAQASPDGLEEIVVTGTHIRGVIQTAAPSLSITRDQLERTGISTVEGLFDTLPQNFSGVSPQGRFANEGGSQIAVNNNSRASGIDLRGLGASSTLTLVNGTRRAGSVGGRVVDISAIPLSVIERVEVVTGGRSAVYGSDAVAGVVNLVTRRDFRGLQTEASYGFAQHGAERLQISQIGGIDTERGGFVAAFDYAHDSPFNLADAGLLSLQSVAGQTQLSLETQAATWRRSGFLAGRYSPNGHIELHVDALYTSKNSHDTSQRLFDGAPTTSLDFNRNPSDQYGANVGARVTLGREWALDLSGGKSATDNLQDSGGDLDLGFTAFSYAFSQHEKAGLTTASAVADGPLFSLGGLTPRAAIGVETRRETFDSLSKSDGVLSDSRDNHRRVNSAFAEILIGLLQLRSGSSQRLELSLAGRYDNYSDFGNTFNPQVGVVWQPLASITLRSAYSKAFRAPALVELNSTTFAIIENYNDPTTGGVTPVLYQQGDNPDLQPEKARTWSAGIDFQPEAMPGMKASLSYFDIKYDQRIEQPSLNGDLPFVLERAARFPGLLNRNPSEEQADEFIANATVSQGFYNFSGVPFDPQTQNALDVFPNLVTFDNRTHNVAIETLRGLDLQFDGKVDSAAGRFTFGLNTTYTLDHDRKITATSPAFSLINEVEKPVDLRARANVGWERGRYGAFMYLNYVDRYFDPYSTPTGNVSSWTTADLTLRFDNTHSTVTPRLLGGISGSLNVENLLDRDPPLFRNGSYSGIRYDTTNASPIGRFVSVRLVKSW